MRRSAIASVVSPYAAATASASRSAPLAISQCARTAFSSNLSQSIRALSQSSNTAEPAFAAAKAADVDLNQLPKDAQSSAARTKDATFASLRGSIDYSLLKALTVKPFGYETMSAVQQSVLHLLPELASGVGANSTPMPDGQGRDMLVKAKTGTGKTIAFLVPALEARLRSIQDVSKGRFSKPWLDMLKRHRPDLDVSSLSKKELDEITKQYVNNTVGALILSPTRELATQIADEAKKLLTHAPDLKVQLLVGGASRNFQINDWRRSRPDVVVATPGRILDLLNDVGMMREAMTACRTLVLDEADTLLEMGFRDDLQAIMKHLPAKVERQNMLFSATVSPEIRAIARASLQPDHRFVDCVPAGEENVHKHIPQYATVLETAEEQIPHILRLIAHDQLVNPGKSKTIVFAPTTKMTEFLADVIRDAQRHFPAQSSIYEIHSKKDQRARFNTSDRFRKDKSGASVLVTSDVSARGVDYPGTTRVIQVGIPSSKDQYIHRIGRTGRAGAQGRSDIVLQNFERGFLHFQLDDLPVNQLHVDDLAQEVETLAAKFDENPQEFAVPDEVFEAARQAKKELKKGGRGRDSFSTPGAKPPAEIRGPLTGKYESSELKPLIAKTLANMEESEESREVFTSLLGFYMGRGDELRTNKLAVLDGLKQWCVQAARMEKAPHLSDSFLQKMGMSMRDMRGGSSSSRGGRGGSGGGYRADSSRSFGRGRFSRDGDSRGDSRDFRGSRDGRDSRDNRDFRGSRDGRDSRGGRSNFGTGRDARQSRFGSDSSASKW